MNDSNESEKKITRQKFFVKLSLGLAGLSAAVASIPVISALIAPLLQQPTQKWRTVGKVNDFADGTTSLVTFENADPKPSAVVTANTAAWLRRNDKNDLTGFASNCTHWGCPVLWEKDAHLFIGPCPGGVYYAEGTVAGGPQPFPLTKYQVRVFNNELQIKTAPVPITHIGSKSV